MVALSMKTLILFYLLTELTPKARALQNIPAKPVIIPAHCEMLSSIDEMKPTLNADVSQSIDLIVVSKAKRKIYFMSKDQVIFAFTTAFGEGLGHKIQEGDQRTPEGTYQISIKNSESLFHKSLGISYPNAEDRAYAKKYHVQPGGDIMIHGMSNKISLAQNEIVANTINLTNWTQGCMAVRNDQIDLVFPRVKVGTPVEICPK